MYKKMAGTKGCQPLFIYGVHELLSCTCVRKYSRRLATKRAEKLLVLSGRNIFVTGTTQQSEVIPREYSFIPKCHVLVLTYF